MKRLLKLAFTLTMLAFAIFTSLNITARPAYAINCFRNFMGCSFAGYDYDGTYECCTYECADGRTLYGACGTAWWP